ncbi:MAG: DUF4238 domain-containing protein [Stenotrophomonas sp.]
MRAVKEGKSRLWAWNRERSQILPITDLNSTGQTNRFYRMELDDTTHSLVLFKYQGVKDSLLMQNILGSFSVMNKVHRYIQEEHEYHENLQPMSTNFLENLYGKLDDAFATLLQSINRSDQSLHAVLLRDKLICYQQLVTLAATQTLRTRIARAHVSNHVVDLVLQTGEQEQRLTQGQKDTFLKSSLFIDSLLLSEEMIRCRPSIRLYLNRSDSDFLTSSSPVIVQLPDRTGINHVEGITLLMALGPRVAMEIHCDGGSDIHILGYAPADVAEFNRRMFEHSIDDLYATSRIQLEESIRDYRPQAT